MRILVFLTMVLPMGGAWEPAQAATVTPTGLLRGGPCVNRLSLGVVDMPLCFMEDDLVTVKLDMSCLAGEATGFQAFLAFDDGVLAFEPGLSGYSAAPFSRHIQGMATAEMAPGEINLDGSVDFDNGGSEPGVTADATLATLVFRVLPGGSVSGAAVTFRPSPPFVTELSHEGVALPTMLADSQSFEIDQQPPTITVPMDITVGNDTGLCSAAVDPGTATAGDDGCGLDSIVGIRDDALGLGDPYPAGCAPGEQTVITWTATDVVGNQASGMQVVTVVDDEAPQITCPPDVFIVCSGDTDPSATGSAVASHPCGAPVITYEDSLAVGPSGKQTITRKWTATSGCGLAAECSHDITLGGLAAPIVSPVGPRAISARPQPTTSVVPVALLLTCPSEPCIFKYVDLDGSLVDTPVFAPPTVWGTVVINDTLLIPSVPMNPVIYDVQAVCGPYLSEPGSAATYEWPDVNDTGDVTVDDLLCLLDGLGGIFSCPPAALNFAPCDLDDFISVDDLLAMLDALGGQPYPCDDPCP